MSRRKSLAIIVCSLGFCAVSASATTVYEFDGNDNTIPANGDVVFTINSNNIQITLTNTGGPGQVQAIVSELDGLQFTLSGGSPVFTDSSLSGSAAGAVDCTGVASGDSCPSSTLPASPYGWTFSGTSTFALEAGGGALHPYAIVNHNVVSEDGVPNSQHNPLLLGPVTFTIDFTGNAPTSVTSATFEFGTVPNLVDGVPCTGNGCGANQQSLNPEPLTFVLTGTGLLALGFLRRRRAV